MVKMPEYFTMIRKWGKGFTMICKWDKGFTLICKRGKEATDQFINLLSGMERYSLFRQDLYEIQTCVSGICYKLHNQHWFPDTSLEVNCIQDQGKYQKKVARTLHYINPYITLDNHTSRCSKLKPGTFTCTSLLKPSKIEKQMYIPYHSLPKA